MKLVKKFWNWVNDKTRWESLDDKYKNKIEELKEEFKNQNIHNVEWVKNLKEKYSADIDTSIYNYIGN